MISKLNKGPESHRELPSHRYNLESSASNFSEIGSGHPGQINFVNYDDSV